ncbi:MAG: aspartyl-tRNA(Asn)/glutamyl-tRNA(Gln) amidotransferase subunit, partial [Patescibacteria group bacterium]|nr:aspartyl-tRNA(Asn)/glutamyl-tRNA(Gln) amidotransferase subunit [Patescibacteria group bacterium]
IEQETRGWDENKSITFSQRKKESSHDYRYFPDPDLPKIYISQIPEFQNLKATLPELPQDKRARLEQAYNIKNDDIETFIRNPQVGSFFETVAKNFTDSKTWQTVANFITSDVLGLVSKNDSVTLSDESLGQMTIDGLVQLVKMYEAGEISSRGAKDILSILVLEGGESRDVATAKNLFQKSDEGELNIIIDQIIEENPKVVTEFKEGNVRSLQFLIGQGMKKTGGSANPGLLGELFTKKLN